MIAESATTTVI